jgi:hypothetical protein
MAEHWEDQVLADVERSLDRAREFVETLLNDRTDLALIHRTKLRNVRAEIDVAKIELALIIRQRALPLTEGPRG